MNKALDLAANYTKISKEDIRLIYHCRKSLLFFNDEAWKKKDTDSSFDVTMGSFDGAELCELIGIYIQSLLTDSIELITKENIGLYRDDGLILLRNINSQQTDRLRKRIIKKFQSIGFKIEIVTNLQEVDFLDVTFNLTNNTYRPYKKPNDNLTYINTSSNHPPNIIKQLTKTISERLSRNSSSIEIFNSSKLEYEDALKKSGYTEPLIYIPPRPPGRNLNGRKRKIIWFNPPFNANVSTNVAKTFLRLIDKHFPRSHKLNKIFNRNTVKVSYSCTENMANIIKGHNNKLTNTKVRQQLACNCRVKSDCPLNGDCRKESIVYKCTACTIRQLKKVYLGLTEGEFKTRYYKHSKSFRTKSYPNSTTLSSYVWEVKTDQNETPNLNWEIVRSVPAYSNITKRCMLCLYEKLLIATYPNQEELLNKRSELVSKCRHENKFLLKNFKSGD